MNKYKSLVSLNGMNRKDGVKQLIPQTFGRMVGVLVTIF